MDRRNFLVWLFGFLAALVFGCGENKKRRSASSSSATLTMPYHDANGYATALAATERAYGQFNVVKDSAGRVLLINGDGGFMHYLVDGIWISNAAGGEILTPGSHSIEWWEVDINSPDLYNQIRIRQIAAFQVVVQ